MLPLRSAYGRLVAAAAVLVSVLGLLYLFGDRRPAPAATPASPIIHSDGMSDAYDGYVIKPVTMPSTRGASTIAFRLLGPDGKPTLDLPRIHEKPLHLYVLRDDMSGYQHLHPVVSGGVWRTPVTISDGGAYRAYAEFHPPGRAASSDPTVLGLPFIVPGDTQLVPMPAPAATARSGALTVTRLDGTANLTAGKQAVIQFKVTDAAGRPVQLQPYLGAFAHLSNFDVRSARLMHLHPLPTSLNNTLPPPDATLQFHAFFAERGDQRMFLQFQVAGVLHQVAFTLFAT